MFALPAVLGVCWWLGGCGASGACSLPFRWRPCSRPFSMRGQASLRRVWSKRLNDAGRAGAVASLFSFGVQYLRGLKDRLYVARHLDRTPLLPQHAVAVDEKGAAIHAEVFLAVELFQFDH